MKLRTFIFTILIFSLVLGLSDCSLLSSHVDYNRDVKPILNKKCISCHGGVKQSGGFSLLSRERALSETESEKPAIIPGSSSESEFIRRLTLEDPEERMPFGGEPLSKEEISILKKWVDQGAEWGLHWAYRPIEGRPDILSMGKGSEKSYIDLEIEEGLNQLGLEMNPRAKKADLLRRASFDLIGMPAPGELSASFLNGEIEFESLIDRLLEMDSYGEKWASMWLDVARYADSKGFERDDSRDIYAYRDYLIKAFNEDKPYDEFIIEQMAGDLLDNPTESQLIATGFHRNTATNDEGGTDNEEYRVKAVLDRVSTTWEGILGTTMACVQCHGHPYDPFPHADFYESYAFLNNTRDNDTYIDYPLLNFLDSLSEQELEEMTSWIAQTEDASQAVTLSNFVKVTQPIIYSLEADMMENAALYDTKYLGFRQDGKARLAHVDLTGKEVIWIYVLGNKGGGQLDFHKDSLNGFIIGSHQFAPGPNGSHLIEVPISAHDGMHDIHMTYHNPNIKGEGERGISINWFHFGEAFPGQASQERQAQWKIFENLIIKDHESTLIMQENSKDRKRQSYVFDRGNWQIHSDPVQPNTPGILPPMDENLSKDRLGFAKWMASAENPLTARTYVNRVWEQLFGLGIVRTVEDLGSQGDLPSHPKLIDQLSYDFTHDMEWRTKSLLKTIMLSDAYQQSAVTNDAKLDKDPYNKYLSRGPRNRLTAEQIRDQALYVSGLLNNEMYGPPVKPYQPPGIWNSPYNTEEWEMSDGDDRFRRAIYTMIKRTAIYPSMETFDMASRQVCTSRRITSNTPLQALVTLNDPVYVEISKAIGENLVEEGQDLREGIRALYKKAMHKDISPEKLDVLIDLYEETKLEITDKEKESIARLTVANALINTDDFLNK